MRVHVLCFAFGVWLLQRQAELPPPHYAWALLAFLPAVTLCRAQTPAARIAGRTSLAICAFAAGFLWAATSAHLRLADELPRAWEARDVELIGVVATMPQPTERSVRFELDVEDVLTPGARVPRRIVLSWWGRENVVPDVHAGERWRLTVRLKRPHGTANPHGFDYEAWLLERGVRATGYVRPRGAPERLAAFVHGPSYWIEAARERLRSRVLNTLADRPYAGIIAALAIGDQRAIPPEQWQTFTRTGVNHLMSISGLHVTMVSGLAYALLLVLWRRSASLTLRLPAPKAAALGGAAAAFFYTLLAGFAVPAQRTLYMVCVVCIALWAGTASSASAVLAAALFTVLLLDPWAVNAPGFWLSFAAVAAIFFVCVNRLRRPNWLAAWLQTQAAVTVALLPVLLALMQQVSLLSPIANAFAIPVVSLVVAPLALLAMMLPFDFVLHFAHGVMAGCMLVLEWLSAMPDAVWEQHAPVAWTVIAAIAGSLWLMAPRGSPGRWLGVVTCLPLFLVLPPALRSGELHAAVLDVGHGLAVLVRTANNALLYDTGPAFGPAVDSGNRIIVPYARALGVKRLDGMVVSHDDADHTGGALSVLQAVPVGWLATSLPAMDPLPLVAQHALRCARGQAWVWDGVLFEMLHPDAGSYAADLKDNDRSCVLKITTAAGTLLITGDIERRSEEALLASASPIKADVLVVPHQGSRTSSTPAFVEAVGASAVIFPVGYRNRFGHPHAEVVTRYRRIGAALYRTDRDGAVLVEMKPDSGITLHRHRFVYRRYWLDAPDTGSGTLDVQLESAW
jgi:competence protein ComEC